MIVSFSRSLRPGPARIDLNLRPYFGAATLIAAVMALLTGTAAGAPYVPKTDAEVVEQLPLKANDPVSRALRQYRAELAADPTDVDKAMRLARRYFDLAMAEGDPRYVGYAEAVIRPWTSQSAPPTPILYLRALLRQYRHDFGPAMTDLNTVLERDPQDWAAMSWRVALHLVQADYAGARGDCERADTIASTLSATACHAVVDGINGKARAAYDRLSAAIRRAPPGDPDQNQWMLTRLGEMALRFGDGRLAEKHFRQAIAASGPDGFVLAAYADYLLDEQRPAEVVALLRDWTRSDVLLLRLALAAAALGAPDAGAHARAMADRFADASLRGDRLHLQEEARFELRLRNNTARALELAAEAWRVQREPRDARMLMEAAIAANKPEAARPALEWLQATGYEDPRYRSLGETLRKIAR
jgi:hypothetical protein